MNWKCCIIICNYAPIYSTLRSVFLRSYSHFSLLTNNSLTHLLTHTLTHSLYTLHFTNRKMVKVIIKSPAVSEGLGAGGECEHHDVQYSKDKDDFRNYEDSARQEIVFNRECATHSPHSLTHLTHSLTSLTHSPHSLTHSTLTHLLTQNSLTSILTHLLTLTRFVSLTNLFSLFYFMCVCTLSHTHTHTHSLTHVYRLQANENSSNFNIFTKNVK
jgi:hypothetical protein